MKSKCLKWAAAIILAMSMTACGGGQSGNADETLNDVSREKAQRLAEVDREIKFAIENQDYETAVSLKDEMLELSKELDLYEEYSQISEKIDEVAAKADEENNDDSRIDFDEVLLAENDTVSLYLVSFYAEDVNWSSGMQNEKYIMVKAKNKSDHKILMNPGKFYIDDEKCYVSMADGSISLDSGKSGTYAFCVGTDTKPEHTALASLDELYKLEGSFEGLHDYDNPKKNSSLEIEFSVPKAISGEVSAEVSAADITNIDELLQGTWEVEGGTFTFDSGTVLVNNNGQSLEGVYEIVEKDSIINGKFESSNGTVRISMPYEYNNGELIVKNNQGTELKKQ